MSVESAMEEDAQVTVERLRSWLEEVREQVAKDCHGMKKSATNTNIRRKEMKEISPLFSRCHFTGVRPRPRCHGALNSMLPI